jgi:hypothetical protein
MFCALGGMPAMTAKQPFRDRKLDNKESVAAEAKGSSLVIQLTRKLPVTPYFGLADHGGSEPTNTKRDADESDLPSFPGESWFGG